jgi:hypothetical protein
MRFAAAHRLLLRDFAGWLGAIWNMLREKARWLHAWTIPDGQFRQMNDVLHRLGVEEPGARRRLAHEETHE